MVQGKTISLSLTGPDSHNIVIQPGQGSFSIGTRHLSKGKYDVLVEEGKTIQWDCFNGLLTPAGAPWPRFLYYSGNDPGFIEWSEKRAVEDFHWTLYKDLRVDLRPVNIGNLHIHTGSQQVTLITGSKVLQLHVSGDLTRTKIEGAGTFPSLHLYPDVLKKARQPYTLPVYSTLKDLTALTVTVPPVGQPFDCNSLLQFPRLTYIALNGSMTGLAALQGLKHLQRIVLRNVSDLSHMPSLGSWEHLSQFIGWNIETGKGKELQKELSSLLKVGKLAGSSISNLRKKIWFETEYGIPFANWEPTPGKIATKAYKAALKDVLKAKSALEVEKPIRQLLGIINELPGMATEEREDAAIAVKQLVASSMITDEEIAEKWFKQFCDI